MSRQGAEGSPPRERDQACADPIEPNPTARLDLRALRWSVPPSLSKEPFDRGAKVHQGPRNDRDGAHRRRDDGQPLASGPQSKPQHTEATQCVERGHDLPEHRDIHPTDRCSNEPAKGFRRLPAPCGMHDQCFVHRRAEDHRGHHGIEPQDWCVDCHLTIARLGAKAAEPPQIDFVRHCRDARRYTRQRSERSARLARSEPAISQGRGIPARLPKRPATRDIAMSGQCHLTVTKVAAHSIGTAPARGPSPATCTGPVHQGRPRKWAHARDSCARHVRSNAVALRWLRLIALDTRWTTLALAGR